MSHEGPGACLDISWESEISILDKDSHKQE